MQKKKGKELRVEREKNNTEKNTKEKVAKTHHSHQYEQSDASQQLLPTNCPDIDIGGTRSKVEELRMTTG